MTYLLETSDPSSAVELAVERILMSTRTRLACVPVRQLIGDTDVDVAYRVQDQITAASLSEGRRIIGRKIGITSQAVQQQLGVAQPVTGVLFADMGFADGDTLPSHRLLQPRAEAEVAFVLKDDLVDGDLDREQVTAAIDHARAALEVTDSRVRNWDITVTDTVADNGSSGLFVLGETALTLDCFDPKSERVVFMRNGQVMSEGYGSACMGDPIEAVVWLAHTARQHGRPLRAGEVVMSGALVPMAPIKPGHTISAEFIHLGSVSARLSSR